MYHKIQILPKILLSEEIYIFFQLLNDPFKFIVTQKMQIREQTESVTSDEP